MDDEIGDDWDDRARVWRRGDVDPTAALDLYYWRRGGCGREFGRDDDGARRRRTMVLALAVASTKASGIVKGKKSTTKKKSPTFRVLNRGEGLGFTPR